jgi:hypothetical protein
MDTSEFIDVCDTCPDAVSRFEKFVKTKYKFDDDTLNEFKTLLKSSQALISGSSVLHSLFNPEEVSTWSANDMDIYVQAKNFIPLRDFLASKCKHIYSPSMNLGKENNYSHSFFKMNKILKMYTFKFTDEKKSIHDTEILLDEIEIPFDIDVPSDIRSAIPPVYETEIPFDIESSDIKSDIDLVMVENSQPIETLIKNYDLSCCMNYYDGETIKSFNLKDTLARKSKLSPDYFKLMSNTKIKRRINKYKKRGFEIILPEDVKLDTPVFPPPNEEDVKRFIINRLFRIIFRMETMMIVNFGLVTLDHGGHYDWYYNYDNSFAYKSKYYDDDDDDNDDDDKDDNDDKVNDDDYYYNKHTHRHYHENYRKGEYEDLYKLPKYIPLPPKSRFFDHPECNSGVLNFDGIDPYEYDCAEKYKKFGKIYTKVFTKVSGILLNLYKEMIKDMDRKEKLKEYDYEKGEYFKVEKSVYSDKMKKYINEYIIPSIKYLEIFSQKPIIPSKFTSETMCYDDIMYEEVKISQFLSKKGNIVIKICDNFKGFDRKRLVDYFNTHNNRIYNGQKLNNDAKEYLADKTIRCYEIIHTGIKNDILIPYSDDKYIEKFNL